MSSPATPVFVDAGAWIALADLRDAHHAAARQVQGRLTTERRPLLTTNLVAAEAYVLIRREGGHGPAVRFLEALRQASRLTMVYAKPDHHAAAESILRQFVDQDFSLADAVSFAVMRELDVAEAFAFDAHFATAGFTLLSE